VQRTDALMRTSYRTWKREKIHPRPWTSSKGGDAARTWLEPGSPARFQAAEVRAGRGVPFAQCDRRGTSDAGVCGRRNHPRQDSAGANQNVAERGRQSAESSWNGGTIGDVTGIDSQEGREGFLGRGGAV
jgi:hypothetical protein